MANVLCGSKQHAVCSTNILLLEREVDRDGESVCCCTSYTEHVSDVARLNGGIDRPGEGSNAVNLGLDYVRTER